MSMFSRHLACLLGSAVLILAPGLQAQPLFDPDADESVRVHHQLMHAEAEASCKSGDRLGFVDAMLRSNEVLALFSQNEVRYVVYDGQDKVVQTLWVESLNYAEPPSLFPLTMLDFSRVATSDAARTEQPVDVILDVVDMADGGFSVNWTMVEYAGGDMDDPQRLDGTPYATGGRPDGELVFVAGDRCWRLAADYRRLQK